MSLKRGGYDCFCFIALSCHLCRTKLDILIKKTLLGIIPIASLSLFLPLALVRWSYFNSSFGIGPSLTPSG